MQTLEHDVFGMTPICQQVIKCKTTSEPTAGSEKHAPNDCLHHPHHPHDRHPSSLSMWPAITYACVLSQQQTLKGSYHVLKTMAW